MGWIFYAGIAMAGLTLYPIASRISDGKISVSLAAILVSVFAAIILTAHLLINRQLGHAEELSYTKEGLLCALAMGVAAAMIDYGYLAAFSKGASASVISPAVTIGSLALVVLFSYFIFKEALDFYKIMGVLLGFASVILLTR